jgi:uncharacterized membrane protein HdeD (DUF308 family)
VLATAFGCFAALDGTVAVVAAVQGRRRDGLALVLDGCTGLAVSAVVLAWPGIPTLGLLAVAVAWGVMRGGAELYASLALRRLCPREQLLPAAAAAVLVAAVVLATQPQDSAHDVQHVLGAAACAAGALLALFAARLWTFRHRSRRIRRVLIRDDFSPGQQQAACPRTPSVP